MTSPTVKARLTAVWARTSDDALIGALRGLDASPSGREVDWARTQAIQELERRYPVAAEAVGAAFDAAELAGTEVNYVAVLLDAVAAAGPGGTR